MANLAIAILIPVLDRPERVRPLLKSLRAADEPGVETHPVFICSRGDIAEIATVEAAGHKPLLLHNPGRCEYARKINLAVELTDELWFLTGADDLHFHPGWIRAAINKHIATGALVIGTNDLMNPTVIKGEHATHSLVHRDYVKYGTIDEPTELLRTVYEHNSVDCEFVETAKVRGMWAFAADSHVEHLHPTFNRLVKRDATYRKGLSNAARDKMLFYSRRKLWDPDAPPVRPNMLYMPRRVPGRAPSPKPRPVVVARWPKR